MKHVNLDHEDDLIKQFVRGLPLDSQGVELELEGQTICQVLPPFVAEAKATILKRGRELAARARARNRGIPAADVAREVQTAIDLVRSRKPQ